VISNGRLPFLSPNCHGEGTVEPLLPRRIPALNLCNLPNLPLNDNLPYSVDVGIRLWPAQGKTRERENGYGDRLNGEDVSYIPDYICEY
jgi:hypothetical protein